MKGHKREVHGREVQKRETLGRIIHNHVQQGLRNNQPKCESALGGETTALPESMGLCNHQSDIPSFEYSVA